MSLTLASVLNGGSVVADARVDVRAQSGKILVASEEIVAYDWRSHTITLAPGVRGWLLNALHKGVLGDEPFVVAVGGKPIYEGSWRSLVMSSSRATPVIVLDAQMLDEGLGEEDVRISLGYPSEQFFKGADPRGDRRIQEALARGGKLKPQRSRQE
ncbi:MAG: hypothetical protein DCC67_04360 [Planctomycetota bacterium]|nr:MAG: hypothetical protein DCC67_04360 [Planctomycetota bacterium]